MSEPTVHEPLPGAEMIDGSMMLPVKEYAAHVGISDRSVKRYLADDEIPGAMMVDGKWMIPVESRRQKRLEGTAGPAVATSGIVARIGGGGEIATLKELTTQPTLKDFLDHETAYLPLEVAARLLGITEYAIRKHPEEYGVVPRGDHGGAVVPQSTIRRIAGI